MGERICLKEFRQEIDDRYVGFKPTGDSIKAVHVADGALRIIEGKILKSEYLKRLSFVISPTGSIPEGNEPNAVREMLAENNSIDEEVESKDLENMRSAMQKLVGADNGVFYAKKGPAKDGMVSFTGGSKYFITKRAKYEDIGEFIGGLINTYCPELSDRIVEILESKDDPISTLFVPVLQDEDLQSIDGIKYDDIACFAADEYNIKSFINGLKTSSKCLANNLVNHPNQLTQLRLFNFFCVFQLIRYMSMLESFYSNVSARPILVDFSHKSNSSIARASAMSYAQIQKSLSRFYAWGYEQKLKDYLKKDLLSMDVPFYERTKNGTRSKNVDELKEMWEMALENCKGKKTEEIRQIFGVTMYDMFVLEVSSQPSAFFKSLGTHTGILYPPSNHGNKRFVFTQDVIEMLLRSCVDPNEVISGEDLRERLWIRFGIIIGGGSVDLSRLRDNGMIVQIDEDALADNFNNFATVLQNMDFAEIMADGILSIRMGGNM